MRVTILLLFLLVCAAAGAQRSPVRFMGHWEGELTWYRSGIAEPRTSKMQLKVLPADTVGHFTWQIIYGEGDRDNRPYLIKPADTLKGHWVIDEKNGILLDQYFVGERLCGSFSVGDYRINNCYWLDGEDLVIEFMTTSAKAVSTTGGTSEEIPKVESYAVHGYQRAILKRRK